MSNKGNGRFVRYDDCPLRSRSILRFCGGREEDAREGGEKERREGYRREVEKDETK